MAKKKKKGSYGKVLGFCVIVGCVAALLFGAGHFGLGGGFLPCGQGDGGIRGDRIGGIPVQYLPPETPAPASQEANDTPGQPGEGEDGYQVPELSIRITRDRIYHDGQEIDMDGLLQTLEALNQPGDIWEVHDDQAIVQVYDDVIALLRENGIEFIER